MSYPTDSRGWTRRLLAESTALLEIGANLALQRRLLKLVPRGDGHPVMLIPGFTASDRSTSRLRGFLNDCGYRAEGWGQGRNLGVSGDRLEQLQRRVRQLAERHGEAVSVIGWSAGGLYARALGTRQPDSVRLVITMGSPFKLNEDNLHYLPEGIHRLHRRLSPASERDDAIGADCWNAPPPVPTTSLYSRADGLAPWPFCLDHAARRCENVHVPGSHAGMTFNPLMYYVIADRLAQQRDHWRPFRMSPLRRAVYRQDCASELSAGH